MDNDIRKAAAHYYKMGANVTAIKRGGKRPVHKWREYHGRRQTREEARALGWHRAGGVGVISGIGGWRCIDIDDCEKFGPVQQILDALGIPHSYRWVVKSGSGRGWHIWIRCEGELPPGVLTTKNGEPGVLTGLPRSGPSFDHLELRWERCQTVLPPSQHASGGRYQFYNGPPDGPPLEVSAERVAKAVRAVCRADEQGPTPQEKTRQNGRAEPSEGLALRLVGCAIDRAQQTHERNKAGLWLACQLRDNKFSEANALRYGRQYVDAVAGDKPEPYTSDEYESSVEQAYSRAAREPWKTGQSAGAQAWGDPVPLTPTRDDPPPLPMEALPPWIRQLVQTLTDFLQVPGDLPFNLALAAVAGTMQTEPFTLRLGCRVTNPLRFIARLRSDVAQGPEGPRAKTGALQDDLQRLYQMFAPSGEVAS